MLDVLEKKTGLQFWNQHDNFSFNQQKNLFPSAINAKVLLINEGDVGGGCIPTYRPRLTSARTKMDRKKRQKL